MHFLFCPSPGDTARYRVVTQVQKLQVRQLPQFGGHYGQLIILQAEFFQVL